jgi:hypothetical protein
MNKTTKVLFAVMLISLFAGSASAVTFTWSDIGSYVADDSTPDIPFTVTGNNSSYTCNLYLNISGTWTAAGTVEATNDTLTSITCNQTLEAWTTYQYNITAYNSTDVPTTHTSSTYTVRYSSFAMLATMVTDMVDIFSAMTGMIVAIIIILVVIAIGSGLVNGFGGMFNTLFSLLRFKK